MSHGCDEDREIGKRGYELTDLLKWEIAQLRVSSSSNSVGGKKVLCPSSVQDNGLRDGDQRKSTQGMDAASMTKGFCNDVVLNY